MRVWAPVKRVSQHSNSGPNWPVQFHWSPQCLKRQKQLSLIWSFSLHDILILQDQNWILRTKRNSDDIVLTISVLLLRVVSEATIVPVVWDTVIVIIRITGISFTIFIMISLVSIGDVRAVILVVLVAIFIYVLIVVTLVTDKVIICISLPKKKKSKRSKLIIVTKHKSTDSLVLNFSTFLFKYFCGDKWYHDDSRA